MPRQFYRTAHDLQKILDRESRFQRQLPEGVAQHFRLALWGDGRSLRTPTSQETSHCPAVAVAYYKNAVAILWNSEVNCIFSEEAELVPDPLTWVSQFVAKLLKDFASLNRKQAIDVLKDKSLWANRGQNVKVVK